MEKRHLFSGMVISLLLLAGCQSEKNNGYLPGVKPPAIDNTMTSPSRSGFNLNNHVAIDKRLQGKLTVTAANIRNLARDRNKKVDVVKIDTRSDAGIKLNKNGNIAKAKVKPTKEQLAARQKKRITFKITLKNIETSSWSWLVGKSPYWIIYRTYWLIPSFDTQQPPASSWHLKQVMPDESFVIAATAPNMKCQNFIVKIVKIEQDSVLFKNLTAPPEPQVKPEKVETVPKNPDNSRKKTKTSVKTENKSPLAVPGVKEQPVPPINTATTTSKPAKGMTDDKAEIIKTDKNKRLTGDQQKGFTDYLDRKDAPEKNLKFVPAEEVLKNKKNSAAHRQKVIDNATKELKQEDKIINGDSNKSKNQKK